MDERQNFSATITVEEDVVQLQSAWNSLVCQRKTLEECRDGLTGKFQYCHCGKQHDSSKFKYHHKISDTVYPPEKEHFKKNTFGKEINRFTDRKEQHMTTQLKNQFFQKKNDSDIRIKQLKQEAREKQVYIDAQKKLRTMNDQYQAFETELCMLKGNRRAVISKLEEINSKIDTLKQDKLSLFATLEEIEKKEKSIQYEMRKLSSYTDDINVGIRTHYAQHLEHKHNWVQDSKVVLCESCDMRNYVATSSRFSSKDMFDKNSFDLRLLEIKSCQLRLEQAMQEMEKLESEVAYDLESELTEKLHSRRETHWQKCIVDAEGDIAMDGAENSVLQTGRRRRSECEVLNRRTVSHDVRLYQQHNGPNFDENVSTENSEQLEKLTEMLMEKCNLYRKEILSIVGQDVKQNISDYQNQSVVKNELQQKLYSVGDRRENNSCNDELQRNKEEETSEASTPLSYEEVNYLDYGSILAYSYFYGYLKLILPAHEFGQKPNGIKEKIVAYINAQHLTEDSFPLTKLIILVPQMLDTPSDLRELSRDEHSAEGKYWIEPAKHRLPAAVVARAGNTKRPYDVPVYKIKDPDKIEKPKYVAATVALKSLFDVVNVNPVDSSEIRRHLQEIILSFCRNLEIIIRESEDCKDLCEIICFAHMDSSGRRVNIARVILERIDKLLAEKNERRRTLHIHHSMRQHMV